MTNPRSYLASSGFKYASRVPLAIENAYLETDITPIIMIIPIITGIITTITQTNYLKICLNLWQSSSDKNDLFPMVTVIFVTKSR